VILGAEDWELNIIGLTVGIRDMEAVLKKIYKVRYGHFSKEILRQKNLFKLTFLGV
jgi:hypothetical protein